MHTISETKYYSDTAEALKNPTSEDAASNLLRFCLINNQKIADEQQKNLYALRLGLIAASAFFFILTICMRIYKRKKYNQLQRRKILFLYVFLYAKLLQDEEKKKEEKSTSTKKQPVDLRRLSDSQTTEEDESWRLGLRQKQSPLRKPKTAKKEEVAPKKAAQHATTLGSSLPTEVYFRDSLGRQFVYPSPADAQYIVYPLLGMERREPVARVNINGHAHTIHTTQYGILDLPKNHGLSNEDILVHQRSLENNQTVFDKKAGFFKTHPVRTAGDQRIYATNQISNSDGLVLHIFNSPHAHAHTKQ